MIKFIIVCLFLMPTMALAHKQPLPKNYDMIVRLTAATIYLEAGGESNQGKLGVASVIWNRASGARDIPKVILARNQFSCWNNRKYISFKPPKNKQYVYCLAVAKDMVNGTFVPPTIYKGVIYYHEQTLNPHWRYHFKMVTQIGNHLFYMEKNMVV